MSETDHTAVSDLIVKCLENEGVKYVFGIPGEENIWLIRSVERSSTIRYVLVRHEQAASFMADAYGRLTGKAGVCSATLGPGAINLLLGTVNAQTCSAPLVALAAQVGKNRNFKESHQIVDLEGIFRPVTKWSNTITSTQALPETIRKAFALAQDGRPGATFVAVPEDVEKTLLSELPIPLKISRPGRSMAATSDLLKAAELLNNAVRPIVLSGHGVARDHASTALVALAERANLPVAVTFHGKGTIPDRHPNAIGTVGFMRHDYENFPFDEADVILAVGYELQEFDPVKINPNGDKIIIHLHDFEQDTDKCYQPSLSLIGSVSDTLTALTPHLTMHTSRIGAGARRHREQELNTGADDDSFPLKPARIVADIRKALGDEDIVFADTGAAKMWVARLYPTQVANTCIISNGLSTMAFALPGAMAAKLAFPNKRVLASMGDAAFLMNSQEIETALRENIPLTVLIWLDDAYGLIKWKMEMELKEHKQVDFMNPDFSAYARSFGAKGVHINTSGELLPALERALSSDGVTVITCPVDYSENIKLTDHLAALTSIA
ncbi:acetolactate synthase large subunit [Acetobacter thailandicus]|uniref:Acetolactate synthase large subunit n=1 Tax=Acetobacter thailandicus TaxID=1502842 RepID=A0ABT3QCM5_9PROT|nr:acetolactate synthase large subunit [Acetobacter thailandicus]MCX2563038.1 acetolactate synthase large subunit [Acetobacter thailandicus]NHN95756.1 acetolactate synthase large subunit [Acetobacter thailandicus]